ncbi:MAG: ABC transporter permease [Hungatella sp.]|jgi:ABC-type antimicrobial peptide transport system permease subunit|nr:ABC transporter permease [Hungatella sp.]MCI9501156.1 ABC transporter permease [Hungatella sp.]MCI9635915.1 ABC transporter permease [Hungatella sp.]
MRFLDLLTMSVNNLRRRKLRTALTVLGVIIGVASVVIMVSLGIGLNALMLEQYASYGDMTTISIYSDSYYGMSSGDSEPNYLTDEVMERFKRLDHVTGVSPMLSTYVIMKQGIYEANMNIIGVTREYLEKIPLAQGQVPEEGEEMKLIYGNWVIQRFYNSKTGEGYWDTGELPDIDYMNKPMFVIFDTSAYYQSQGGGENQTKPPKKYMINAAGVVEGGIDDYNSYAYSAYTDIDALKTQLKQIYKKNPIPDQPTNKKGKPYPYFIYEQAVVFVDEMSNVTDVQQTLIDMGFQADSQMQWIEQSQQTYDVIQLVLGGIGAISLFVAAIGIANTMMMSIYERTKEIGVIKVLGCDMGNIRNMFLMESGFIGFMGGVIGLIISFTVSYVMNNYLGIGQIMMGIEGDISRIPLWLAGAAIGFAILVGMVAGFFPSLRAMKLSPLAAIRNE